MGILNLQEMLETKKIELTRAKASREKLIQGLNDLTVVQLKLEASIATIEEILKENSDEPRI